jgi:hypothetical protein
LLYRLEAVGCEREVIGQEKLLKNTWDGMFMFWES